MTDFVNQILAGQFEAGLCMLNDCLEKCPEKEWDGIIGKYPFWQVAYHTLCFVDLYLSPGKEAFEMRSLHPKGWAEFDDEYPSRRFEKGELLEYLAICREKMKEVMGAERRESLEGPSGFSWLAFSRGEAHLYNLRHLQHHAGQLSAYLRRVEVDTRWVKTGWK